MFVVFVSVSKIDDYKTIRYLFNSEENLMLMKKRPKTVATNVATTFRWQIIGFLRCGHNLDNLALRLLLHKIYTNWWRMGFK